MIIICRLPILILLWLVFAVTLTAAQTPDDAPPARYAPKKDEVKGPRAIAVLESTPRGMWLIPITIKVDDQFYDATIYKAQPVPMALDSGVIYEIFKSGEPVGDFTIQDAEQNQGSWRGVGSFVSKAQEDRAKAQRNKEKAAEAAQKVAEDQEEMGSRPVLKRAKPKEGEPADGSQSTSTSGSSGTSGSSPSSTQSTDASDRPVLKKPAENTPSQSAPTTTASTQAPASSSTPAPASPSAPPATSSAPSPSNDSDAPVLRRAPVRQTVAGPYKPANVPGGKQTKQTAGSATAVDKETMAAPSAPQLTNMQVAISDATPQQVHPYQWEWKDAEEQAKLKSDAEKLALAEINKFAARTSGAKPGNLIDINFDAFDLNYTNSAVVVLSARAFPEATKPTVRGAKAKAATAPAEGLEFYVTVVGRVDIYGQMQKELAVATDNKHLDAYPKMRLIDAVDVDGNGGADLLFRSTSDVSNSFVIYRDKGWSLEEVISVAEPKG